MLRREVRDLDSAAGVVVPRAAASIEEEDARAVRVREHPAAGRRALVRQAASSK
jgi:hypothetical protein